MIQLFPKTYCCNRQQQIISYWILLVLVRLIWIFNQTFLKSLDFLNVNQDFRLKFKLLKIKCFNQLISFDLYKIGFEGGDEKRASSEKMGGDNKQQRREINSFSSPALFLPMTINNPQAKFSSFSQKQNIWFKNFDESRKILS